MTPCFTFADVDGDPPDPPTDLSEDVVVVVIELQQTPEDDPQKR